MQKWADRPSANFGFAFQFSGAGSFGSSDGGGRPSLELEIAPAPQKSGPDLSVNWIESKGEGSFVAHLENIGAEDSPARSATWTVKGQMQPAVTVPALAKGQKTDVALKVAWRAEGGDPRGASLSFQLSAGDVNGRNDGQSIYPNGSPILLEEPKSPQEWSRLESQLRWLNDTYPNQSRYACAPTGVKARFYVVGFGTTGIKLPTESVLPDIAFFRRVLRSIGMPNFALLGPEPGTLSWRGKPIARGFADRFAGVFGGDARTDGLMPVQVSLNDDPLVPNQITSFGIVESLRMYSPTEAAWLNNVVDGLAQPALPLLAIVRVLDRSGRSLEGSEVELYRVRDGVIEDNPFQKLMVRGGSITPSFRGAQNVFGDLGKDYSNGLVLARVVRFGVDDWAALKVWRALDSVAKGSRTAPLMELRFNVPSSPVDTIDLAVGRNIEAPMAGLTVEGNTTLVSVNPGSSITIDLGRDRAISTVRLETSSGYGADSVSISLRGTGQEVGQGIPWAIDSDLPFTASQRMVKTESGYALDYLNTTQRYRFVTVANTSSKPLTLTRVKVFGVKTQEGG